MSSFSGAWCGENDVHAVSDTLSTEERKGAAAIYHDEVEDGDEIQIEEGEEFFSFFFFEEKKTEMISLKKKKKNIDINKRSSVIILFLCLMVEDVADASINHIVAFSVGKTNACAVEGTNNQAKCWGLDYLTIQSTTSVASMGINLPFIDMGWNNTVSEISDGGTFTCAVLGSGNVKCWGQNNEAQLGLGITTALVGATGDSLPYVNLGTGMTAVYITCGTYHACVILATNLVKCWGNNEKGQLGIGIAQEAVGYLATDMGDALPTLNLGTALMVETIRAGWLFTCALLLGSSLMIKCWGDNSLGQLGIGSTQIVGWVASGMGDALAAIDLGTNIGPLDFATGLEFVCAIVTGFALKCWGDNSFNQLGLINVPSIGTLPNEMGDNLPYVDLGTNVKVLGIATGDYHACALTTSYQVKCWGSNSYGQLGLGSTVSQVPITTNQMGNYLPYLQLGTEYLVTELDAGGSTNCGLMNNKKMICWGNNMNGELGICSSIDIGTSPSQMGNNLQFVDDCGPTYPPTIPLSTGPTSFPTVGTWAPMQSQSPTYFPTTLIPTRWPSIAPTQSPSTITVQGSADYYLVVIIPAICIILGLCSLICRRKGRLREELEPVLQEKYTNAPPPMIGASGASAASGAGFEPISLA